MIVDATFQFSSFTYQCNICSKKFDTCLGYLEHQDEHEGKPLFKCEKCDEVCQNFQEFFKRLYTISYFRYSRVKRK